MEEESVLIKKDRVSALIGEKGRNRKFIESKAKVKLGINSETGLVRIQAKGPINVYASKQVIEAINQGFPAHDAIKLLSDEYTYDAVNLTAFGAKERKDKVRLRSRVIGTKGKVKHVIEEYTNCKLAIFGKTVAILGPAEKVEIARRAVEIILAGSNQGTAFKWLAQQTE